MQGIYKSFGANDVLKDIDFSVSGGEICALLGENGAGKSTLMNILGGVIQPDAGKIMIDGEEKHFSNPAQSLEEGIAFIHQELNLINDLAVYENMFIGREIKKKLGFLNAAEMCRQTEEIFKTMKVDIDPRAKVSELDASYKQIVEIARALLMNASVIIMDEPTSSLTDVEIERVFSMMRTLKEQGVALVFISHKLGEVMEICTRYCVLRNGVLVAEGKVADTDTDELATFMVGHEVRTESLRKDRSFGEVVLKAEHLSQEGYFEDISFEVREGEVLGFTGLLGDGRSELFQAIFGDSGRFDGELSLEGKAVHIKSTIQAVELGIGYVPRNRKENGIIKDMNILENGSIVTWKNNLKSCFIDRKKVAASFKDQTDNLRIKMDDEKGSINSLSGGNQQKVVLAKWLCANPKVLVFDNPTQGVDVGAKEDIYDVILELANSGVAIIVLSSEAQEIIRICDRTLVMYHGRVRGELPCEEMTEQNIMTLATGGKIELNAEGKNGTD